MNFMRPPYQHLADELQRQIEEKDNRLHLIDRSKRRVRLAVSYLLEEDRSWCVNFLHEFAERLGKEVR